MSEDRSFPIDVPLGIARLLTIGNYSYSVKISIVGASDIIYSGIVSPAFTGPAVIAITTTVTSDDDHVKLKVPDFSGSFAFFAVGQTVKIYKSNTLFADNLKVKSQVYYHAPGEFTNPNDIMNPADPNFGKYIYFTSTVTSATESSVYVYESKEEILGLAAQLSGLPALPAVDGGTSLQLAVFDNQPLNVLLTGLGDNTVSVNFNNAVIDIAGFDPDADFTFVLSDGFELTIHGSDLVYTVV
jgi:hypothetical protein